MRYILLLLFAAFSAIYAKTNVAVLDFESTFAKPGECKTITNKFSSGLIRSDKFTVVERQRMADILKEQGFQKTGCTSEECAVEIGQLLGVEKIITGSIGKVEDMYVISVRVLNVEKGNIEIMVEDEIEGTLKDVYKSSIPKVVAKLSKKSTSRLDPNMFITAGNLGCGEWLKRAVGSHVKIRLESRALVVGKILKNAECYFIIRRSDGESVIIYKKHVRGFE